MERTLPPNHVELEISLPTLTENFCKIRAAVAPLGVVVVLKANAYGMGVAPIAQTLVNAGAAAIAVAELAEAIAVQDAISGAVPILILGTLFPEEIPEALEAGIRLPVAGPDEARAISDCAQRLGKTARCHLAIDSGMSRIGIHLREARSVIPGIAALPHLVLEGLYSHFPTANLPGDPATQTQVAGISALARDLARAGIPIPFLHLANSDGINNVPASYTAPFTHVRTGINLLGSFDPIGNRRLRVEPVLRLRTRLAQVRTIPAGATVGYGRTYTAPREMRVGTVAAGYADGLPLALSNRGEILVRGRHCPVIGRICMDYTTVALDQVPDAAAGDEAVCLGRQGDAEISIDTWASLKGTHAYEILCAIGSRVRRTYRS